MMLSQRVRTIEPSATLGLNAIIQKLKADGRDIVNFSVGEPDFDTPEFIREAGKRAIDSGKTRYTPVPGTPEFRQAVADYVGSQRGESIDASEVVICSGAKQALTNAFASLCDPGDEVLLPAPYWVSYPDEIRLAEATPVGVYPAEDAQFRITPEALAPHVTPRTAGLIINSPSNPTGVIYSPTEIAALVDFAEQNDLWIISDEIYERFVFEGTFASPFAGKGRERTILVSGLSKSFAMTGWRLGWAVGDKSIIGGMSRLQGHTASNACTISQYAGLEAVKQHDHADLQAMIAAFDERRLLAVERLAEIEGLVTLHPEGAFYLFVDVRNFLSDGATTTEFCEALLDEKGVATVPGEAFGTPGWLRLSYARSIEEMERGLKLFKDHLSVR